VADVDPAADWERLAAGAQATESQAARWRAQTDADVANEWPGPPLRTPVPNGLPGGGAVPRPAADPSVDDAQTDPGLPGPSPATEEPGRAEASPPAPPQAGAAAATVPDAAAAATVADPPEPAPAAREARRSRFKRAGPDLPAEPDAADEWISLLTADPVDE
jgi:hypothetical protein